MSPSLSDPAIGGHISLSDDHLVGLQMDITAPTKGVEVLVHTSVIHINVDGICRLRICRIPRIIVEDNRR